MGSVFQKREVGIIQVVRVKEHLVLGGKELCGQLEVGLEEPRFRNEDEIGIVSISDLSYFKRGARISFNIPGQTYNISSGDCCTTVWWFVGL